MHRLLTKYATTLALSTLAAAAAAQGPILELSAGIHVIRAEVAYTVAVRMQGLMHRDHLGPNQGMLFVFPDLDQPCMWMKNTLIPLSVAFLDDKGAIINVEDMAPQTETSHCAKAPARYALEMELGWFKKHGAAAGSKIAGVDHAPDPQ
jgi:uncharacterized membrane protein (UPF0127 family)